MDNQKNELHEPYKFYVCSVGQPGEGYDKENLARCEKYSAHFMANDASHKGVFKDVTTPAIAILKYKNVFVAYGEIVKVFVDEGNKELGKWDHIVKVEQWIWKDPNDHTKGVRSEGIRKHVIAGGIYATIKQIDEWGLEKVNKIDGNSDLAKKLNS